MHRSCNTKGKGFYLRLRAYLRASRRTGMQDPDRALRRILEARLTARTEGGTSAAGSSGSPVSAAARILQYGMYLSLGIYA